MLQYQRKSAVRHVLPIPIALYAVVKNWPYAAARSRAAGTSSIFSTSLAAVLVNEVPKPESRQA
jgi:hypothetical protein